MYEWMKEWMFNNTPARKTVRLLGVESCKTFELNHGKGGGGGGGRDSLSTLWQFKKKKISQ